MCIVRDPNGKLTVGSSRPKIDPGSGPAWAKDDGSIKTTEADGSSHQVGGFKLLYAGTADKVMMLELEADKVCLSDQT